MDRRRTRGRERFLRHRDRAGVSSAPVRRPSLKRSTLLGSALAASLALFSSQALADARTEARGHFKKGMGSIAAGRYEVGIDELKKAYEILPHPNVLFNIARAYVEMGDIENAITYYKQYVAENPPDKDEVTAIIGQLQARLDRQRAALAAAQTTAPTPGATPTTPLPAGTQPTEPGQPTTTTPGPTTGTAAGTPSAPGPGDEKIAGEERTEAVYEESVVTASRGAAQSPLESPNSTTIISEQDIRLSGATKIPELFRRVAGIDMLTATAGQTEVGIRGFNQRLANKVTVLVDGRSVYVDWFGGAIWETLSIDVDQIERIEIVRGPGSALYGADAFSGVINIITKAPGTGRSGFRAGVGSDLSAYTMVRATGRDGDFAYRASAGYTRYNRWSYEHDLNRTDLNYVTSQDKRASENVRLDLRTTRRFGKDVVLGVGGGFNTGLVDLYAVGVLKNWSLRDGKYGDATIYLNTAKVNTRVFYNFGRIDRLGAAYGYTAQDLYGARFMYNTVDVESVYADKFETGPLSHAINFGANYRLRNAFGEPTGGDRTEHHYGVFAQDSIAFGRPVTLMLSGRVDRVPYTGRFEASPRVSLLVKPNDRSTFRGTFATAFRKPTFLESYTEFPVQGPQGSITALTKTDRFGGIQPERILTAEIGYLNQMSDVFDVDVAAFYNRVTDLITLAPPVFATPSDLAANQAAFDTATGRYVAQYSGFVNQCADYNVFGGELGVKTYPVQGLDIFANYALAHTQAQVPAGCDVPADRRTSAHKFNAGVQLRTKPGVDAELTFHYVSNQRWVERDLSIAAGGLVFQQSMVPEYHLLNARLGYRFPGNKAEIYGTAFNLTNQQHQEHPFTHFVGRRFMAFIQYQF